MKPKTPRSQKYLRHIREQSCIACQTPFDVQAAHVRMGNGGGMGLKPSDYRTLPLCASCHRQQHAMGEESFWAAQSLDPDVEIAKILAGYIAKTSRVPKEVISALETLIDEKIGKVSID